MRFAPAMALLSLFLFPLLSATCPFLDVSIASQASVVQGVNATYPLAFTNRDLFEKTVSVSGTCPENAGCLITPVPFKTIQPSDTHTFTLMASTAKVDPGNYSIGLDVSTDGEICQTFTLRLEVKPASPAKKSPFEVVVTPNLNQSARPSETLTYQIVVRNNQAERGFARLSVETPLRAELSANDISLDGCAEKAFIAKITPPAGTPRVRYDSLFVVNAFDGSGCCEYPFATSRQVFVFSDKLDLALQNVPLSCITVQHENQTGYTFRVRNNGETAGPFQFYLEGLPSGADFMTLDTSLLEIKPGDAAAINLKIAPSRKVDLRAYAFRLKAQYHDFTVFEKPLCVNVDAVKTFRVFGPDSVQVVRGEATRIDYLVRNTGTVRQAYSLSTNLDSPFDVRLLDNSLTLNPGEAQNATLLVTTTLQTPLGDKNPAILRVTDGKVTKFINTTLSIVSSTKPGRSFLGILAKPITGYSGATTSEQVGVKNLLTKTQHNVTLAVRKLPEGFAAVKSGPKSILPGKTAYYDVDVSPPSNAEGKYTFNYYAESQAGEKVETLNVLTVQKPPAFLNVVVANVLRRGDEVSFTVVVYNNGAVPLNDVVVEAGDKTLTLDRLQPGEQRLLAFQALAATPLLVKARAAEGIQSNTETIPQAEVQGSPIDAPLVGIIVLALVLIAIAFLIRKEQLEHFAQGTA